MVLSRLESAGFGWWIVFVAGAGFFCDAYDASPHDRMYCAVGPVPTELTVDSRYSPSTQ